MDSRPSTGARGGYSRGGSDQQQYRGGRGGGGRGGGGGGGRGGGSGGGGSSSGPRERTNILDLSKYMDKQIQVKFVGGREVVGVLKGFDTLSNLVLDETVETIREETEDTIIEKQRSLGMLVARGPTVMTIAPADGLEEIDNPFVAAGGEAA
ncbi:hypothetical protein BC828DRAFT_372820 [Blastocladiella britannica]|nr:hypothetical protein BC828DRAFT_372820 [Blastocladiella britannica]